MPWHWATGLDDDVAILEAFELAHLRKVMRKRVGGEVRLLDGRGGRASGTLLEDGSVAVARRERMPAPDWTLILGLGSRESNEESLRRAAELGVARILPVHCARSRDAGAPKSAPRDRWLKIMQSACGQSGNAWLPELAEPATWDTIKARYAPGDVAVLAPGGAPLPDWRAAFPKTLAVGPEGGWTVAEIADMTHFDLGPFIMRTHVAVAAVAAYVAQRSLHALP